jgi:hypothetical protein
VSTVGVNGIVTDSSGAAVPGATITAVDTSTGTQKTAESDAQGRYTIVNLQPGNYDVEVGAKGFATSVRRGQVLLVGQTVTLNFALQVASVAQTVEVHVTTPQTVPTTQSMVEAVIEPSEIQSLPSASRSFSDLAVLSPGVTITGGTSEVSDSGESVTMDRSTTFHVGWTRELRARVPNRIFIREVELSTDSRQVQFIGSGGWFVLCGFLDSIPGPGQPAAAS